MTVSYEVVEDFLLGGSHFVYDFSLEEFKRIIEPLIQKAVAPIPALLERGRVRPDSLDLVLLAGGTSQLPGVREAVQAVLPGSVAPRAFPKDVLLAVSRGAALFHQKLLEHPNARAESLILGRGLGVLVNDHGDLVVKPLLYHDASLPATATHRLPSQNNQRVDIRLCSGDGIELRDCRELKQRYLELGGSSGPLELAIEVDANKRITLVARDQDDVSREVRITIDQDTLEAEGLDEYRRSLGIETDGGPDVSFSDSDHPAIGIDLGTTTCEIARWAHIDWAAGSSRIESLGPEQPLPPDDYGKEVFPSVVAILDDGPHAGDYQAYVHMGVAGYEDRVVTGFKVENPDVPVAEANGAYYYVRDLQALLLRTLWQRAHFGYRAGLTSAVVTVPADFDPDQCRMVEDAAKAAGIEYVYLLDEPSSAFWYYHALNPDLIDQDDVKQVLVFDWGGGTADLALLDIRRFRYTNSLNQAEGHKFEPYQQLATGGDNSCGGEHIDQVIAEHFQRVFEQETGESLDGQYGATARLLKAARKAKIALSQMAADAGEA